MEVGKIVRKIVGVGFWLMLAVAVARPAVERPAKMLTEMLAELHELPGVLIVFNHPLWDLYRIGKDPHDVLVNEFLAVNGQFIHALSSGCAS